MAYDAFISYSHAGDDLLAPRLQQSLQRFAKPWWRRRALRVFRDDTALSANPGLWSSITDALDETEWFVLLASPDAVESPWVSREVQYWCDHKDPARILPVVTDGTWAWDAEAADFDWAASTAVPLALAGMFAEQPRHVDMRWARSETQLDLHNGRFRDQVAELAAPIHGLAKDEMAGEDVRAHRRTMRTAWAAVLALILLLGASVAASVQAVRAADEARASEQAAVEARDEADRQAALAVSSAEEAERRKQEADASAVEASRQRNQADVNAQEAERQRAEADRNAANAEAQRRAADAANSQLASTVNQLTETNDQLDEANEGLASSNQRLDQTNQALDQTNQALGAANQDLESANGQLQVANQTLTSQAANLDASRLAALADDTAGERLDTALLLAAEAQQRAATDSRRPRSALFDLLEVDGRGLERVLRVRSNPLGLRPVVAVSPGDEWLASAHVMAYRGNVHEVEISLWAGGAPAGTAPRTIPLSLPNAAPEELSFGAGGRYLFVHTVVPIAIVDPEAPLPPRTAGVEVIDVQTGARVLSYAPTVEGTVVFSANGDHAGVQTCLPAGADDCVPTVAVVDARSGRLIRERPGRLPSHLGVGGATAPDSRTDADFSPDGRSLLVFAPPGEFQIWPLDQPNVVVSLYTPAAGTFTVPSFDTTGSVVAGSSGPGLVQVFDVRDGSLVRSVALPSTEAVVAVAAAPEGTVLGVLQAGRLTRVVGDGAGAVVEVGPCADDVTVSPRHQWFVLGGSECATTDLVHLTDGRDVGPLTGGNVGIAAPDGVTESVAFQLAPRRAFPEDDSSFGAFDLRAGRWIAVRRDVAFSAAPRFDRESGTLLIDFGSPAALEAWSADGSSRTLPGAGLGPSLFGSSSRAAVVDTAGTIAVWALDRLVQPERVAALPSGGFAYSWTHVVSPNGDLVASIEPDDDSTILLTDVASGEVTDRVAVPGGRVTRMAFIAGGRQLAMTDYDNYQVRRYDVPTRSWSTPLFGQLVSTSLNGRYLGVKSWPATVIRVFDVALDREIAQFTTSADVFDESEVVLSNDGRFAVVQGAVHDLPSQRLLHVLPGDRPSVGSLAMSPDGDRLYRITQAENVLVEVLDTMSGRVAASRFVRRGANTSISFFAPLRVGHDDATIWAAGELLDAATLTPIGAPGQMLPQDEQLGSITFTRDGRSVLVVSDANVYRFTIGGRALADRACAIAGRNLTAEERTLYLSTAGAPACTRWPAGG